ncbi:MAG: hypothetical protein AABW79_03400 [Nanoarchaeota archaeon]
MDELKEYMLSEGIFRLSVRGVPTHENPSAHITSDGRIVAEYSKGFGPFKKQTTRVYNLRDLPEVLCFLDGRKHITCLDQVCTAEFGGAIRMIENSVILGRF